MTIPYPDDPTDEIEPVPSSATIDELGPIDEFDPIDDEFAPRARQRLGKFTAITAAALAIGLGFLGGTYVQKHYGSSSSTAAGAGAARAGFARAAAAGGYGGGFGGADATGGGRAIPGGQAGASADTTATPAVIGTVVSVKGLDVVVKNLGDKSVSVRMTAATTITTKASVNGLKAGQTVAVVGTTGTGGVVTATTVTVQ